jgi:hypothetical protein
MANKLTLEQQANKILKQAEKKGVANNYFFTTTFARYQMQMKILADLEESIAEHGVTSMTYYSSGRESLQANPAIQEYNRTATAANGTVKTLIAIVESFPEEPQESKLGSFLKANE